MLRIRHGFPGQRRAVLPFYLTEKALTNPLTSGIVLHSMGFFPTAEGHYIKRPNGCGEHILIYCTKGKGYYSINGKIHTVSEQQFFVLPANVPHMYWSDTDNPWTIYYAHFKGPASAEIARRLPGIHTLTVSDTSRINERIKMFDEILNILEASIEESALLYANMSFSALLASMIEVEWFRKSKFASSLDRNESFVSRVAHLMEEKIGEDTDIREIASYFGYSESHFSRLFHAETGFSPYDYLLTMKTERAKDLLIQTSLKINQIAKIVGFNDVYYFSKFFHKKYGMSPRQFRSMNT